MMKHIIIGICVIIPCVSGVEIYALSQGIDGKIMQVYIGIIGVAIGALATCATVIARRKGVK